MSKARYDFFSQMQNPIQRSCLMPEEKPTHYLGLGYYPIQKPRYQPVETHTCWMITIKNILAIQDGKEPGFIPNQGMQRNDSSSESKVEEIIFGRNGPQFKVQTLATEETTLKSKEAIQDKEIKETKEAPPELENGGQVIVDELIKVELGEGKDHTPTFVSALLSQQEKVDYVNLLKEFNDCFAWNYKEMPCLDPEVIIHKLAIISEAIPVKQTPRRIREEKYPEWIADIILVKKKNDQI